MSNWFSNTLTIVGDEYAMKSFFEKAIELKDGRPVWKLSNTLAMPNRLENTIYSSDRYPEFMNEDEVQKAIEAWNNGDKDVQIPELIPCENSSPEKRAELIQMYGAENWRDWREKQWGVDRDCSTEDSIFGQIEILNSRCFRVWFRSRNNTPYRWLENMIRSYPNLYFKLLYKEFALGYTGLFFTDRQGGLSHENGEFYWVDSKGRFLTEVPGGLVYEENSQPVSGEEQVFYCSTASKLVPWFERDQEG